MFVCVLKDKVNTLPHSFVANPIKLCLLLFGHFGSKFKVFEMCFFNYIVLPLFVQHMHSISTEPLQFSEKPMILSRCKIMKRWCLKLPFATKSRFDEIWQTAARFLVNLTKFLPKCPTNVL